MHDRARSKRSRWQAVQSIAVVAMRIKEWEMGVGWGEGVSSDAMHRPQLNS